MHGYIANTKKWIEFDSLCADTDIIIVGSSAFNRGSSNLFFTEIVFKGLNETFDTTRMAGTSTNDNISSGTSIPLAYTFSSDDQISDFMLSDEGSASIGFFSLPYILTSLDQELIQLIPIVVGDGDSDNEPVGISSYKEQDGETGKSLYPLSRQLYMYLYNDETSLQETRPFMQYGLSNDGDSILNNAGFWPIEEWEKIVMLTRLQIIDADDGGVSMTDIQKYCPIDDVEEDSSGAITIAGSSTVFPVAQLWSEIFSIGCNNVKIDLNGGGSSVGAGRVCGNTDRGTPVDIGNMSREWRVGNEADVKSLKKKKESDDEDGEDGENANDDFLYTCLEPPGDSSRSAIQIDVAIDGLTIAVQEGGVAYQCIQLLGGLSVDQLRWIYSNYNDRDLVDTGWDQNSLRNSDFNSQTHLWSELDGRCEHIEIRIAGADDLSGTYEYFSETVFTDHDNGETFDTARPGFGYENSEDDEKLVTYLQEFGEAISYFGYSYYYVNRNALSAVPVQNNDGNFVLPDPTTIGDGTYNPLARRIYMNLLNDEDTLKHTIPFVKFGLNNPALVGHTGYVAIPQQDVEMMINRLDNAPYDSKSGVGKSYGMLVVHVVLGITTAALSFLA